MRRILIILFIFIALKISAHDYYLSPTGSDASGVGSLANPWFTLNKAWTVIAAGDTVYMRGGTYTYVSTQALSDKNGTSGNLIKVWAYSNEKPHIVKASSFSYDGWTAGLHLVGNYIHFKGIEMSGFAQQANGIYHTFLARNCSYCIFEELNCHHGAYGFYLMENGGGTATENLILNCDFHHNYDPLTVAPGPYQNADGMAIGYITNSTSTNTVRGCRFYRNSDDGIDLWANEGYVLIDDCLSYHNGYREDGITHGGDGNGFKFGDVQTSIDAIRKKVINCVAFENYDMGFTQNSWTGTRINACELYNNVAYKNGKEVGKGPGFQFGAALTGTTVNIFKNNISYANWNDYNIEKETVDISMTNSWDGVVTVTDADFISLDSTGISGARVNGAKPSIDYLKLVVGSDLVNAGTDVGIGFHGTNPDLGYFETLATYYVKNGGSDTLDGLTDATAWGTIAKVNSFTFAAGDSILFNKGDVWREYISFAPPAGTTSGRVVYSSYGTGNKPLFLGSKEENEVSDWADQGGNIWKNADAQFNYGDGVGNLIFNGEESIGHKELTIGSVNAQGDWFWNDAERAVYLYSVGNPGTVYTDIECALDRTIITLGARDYITLDGLDVRYGGYHGIEGAYGNDNVTIRNCHISYIGGCEFPDVMARVGNGIQFWNQSTNILIENNVVEEIYDDGITPQTDTNSSTYTVQIDIIGNLVRNCRLGLHTFERSVNSTIQMNWYNNTVVGMGEEWGADQRPDSTFGARSVRIAGVTGTIDYFNIKNNIFYDAGYVCFYTYGSVPLGDLDIDYNLYYNTIGDIGGIETTVYATLGDWQAATSQEVHAIGVNPLFVSSTDFNLQSGSPAIDKGIDVGLSFNGSAPDIGAYESNYNHGVTFAKDANGNFIKDSNGNFIKIIQ